MDNWLIYIIEKYSKPYAGSPGDWALHEFRAGKKIPAEAVDECRTRPVRLAVMKNMKILHLDITTKETLDNILVFVIAPDGVNGYVEAPVAFDVNAAITWAPPQRSRARWTSRHPPASCRASRALPLCASQAQR